MLTRKRWYSTLVLAVVIALTAVACGNRDTTTTTAGATTTTAGATTTTAGATTTTSRDAVSEGLATIDELVVIASSLAELHLDPIAPIEFGVYKVNMTLMYDWIIGSNPDGTLNPDTGLVKSWERFPEENSWVFKVREGITFQNGETLAADDIVFQVERVLDPESGSGSQALFAGTIQEISVVDEYTFKIITPGPDITVPFLLSNQGLLEGLLAPKDYFLSLGDDAASRKEAFLNAPIGSGPYKVVEAVPGSHILLERNEDYWQGTPVFPRIRVIEVSDEATRFAALQNGEAHITEISRKDALAAQDAGFVIHRKPGGATMGMVIHEQWVDGNPLANIKVRQALQYAIDKEGLLNQLFFGQGRLVDTWRVGSHALGYEYNVPPAYDPDRARQLLAEAGAEGMSLTLLGYERQGLPEARDMMEALTSMMQDVGIDATLEWTDQGVVFETWFGYPDHPTQSPMMERWGPSISMNNTGNQTFWQQNAKFVFLENSLALIRWDDEITGLIATADGAQDNDVYAATTRAAQQWSRDGAVELAMFELDTLFASVPEITSDLWPQDVYQFSWNLETLVRAGL